MAKRVITCLMVLLLVFVTSCVQAAVQAPTPTPSPTPTPTPLNYSLTANTIPGGAALYLNGEYKGRTPVTVGGLRGTCYLNLVLRGYADTSKSVIMAADQSLLIHLEPLAATPKLISPSELAPAPASTSELPTYGILTVPPGAVARVTGQVAEGTSVKIVYSISGETSNDIDFYANYADGTTAIPQQRISGDGGWALGNTKDTTVGFYFDNSDSLVSSKSVKVLLTGGSNWNWRACRISMPVAEALAPIAGRAVLTFGLSDGVWQAWQGPNALPLSTLVRNKGYVVFAARAFDLVYDGHASHLEAGWNLIGWFGPDTEVSSIFNLYKEEVVFIAGFDTACNKWSVFQGPAVRPLTTIDRGTYYCTILESQGGPVILSLDGQQIQLQTPFSWWAWTLQ